MIEIVSGQIQAEKLVETSKGVVVDQLDGVVLQIEDAEFRGGGRAGSRGCVGGGR